MVLAVVGCAVPASPVGGWTKMNDHSSLMVGCNASADVWRLTCVDGRWAGATATINCSTTAATADANAGNSAATR